MSARRGIAGALLSATLLMAACGGDGQAEPGDTGPDVEAADCIVRLHGRAGTGAPDVLDDGIAELRPTGNRENLGGFAWFYATPAELGEVTDIIAATADASSCTDMVLTGFSNGGAAAAKVYCSGETFDGRLRGVLIDDPVPDAATEGCTPAADVAVALYWTGGLLPDAVAGAGCDDIGYLCDGEALIGIDAMAANLGVPVSTSPLAEHIEFVDAPEPRGWLGR